jgi:hypothetical protein
VFRVDADDAHHAFAVDHLALVANLLDGRSNFHSRNLVYWPPMNADERGSKTNFLSDLRLSAFIGG